VRYVKITTSRKDAEILAGMPRAAAQMAGLEQTEPEPDEENT